MSVMITKKSFYFVRHGQTDYNVSAAKKSDQPDTPLNETGRAQAKTIEPLIASLPIQTVFFSPLRRAKETKEIVTSRLQLGHYESLELGECSKLIWEELMESSHYDLLPPAALAFVERVRLGINQALSLPGPSLIVSHGGVHWALCCLMDIKSHHWIIENCQPVYFFLDSDGSWEAQTDSFAF